MACCKQHAGHGEHAGHTLRLEAVEAGADDGGGKFEVAVFDRILRQALLQVFGKDREFPDRVLVAAAVAAQHNTQFFRHWSCLPIKRAPGRGPVRKTAPALAPLWVGRTGICFQSRLWGRCEEFW